MCGPVREKRSCAAIAYSNNKVFLQCKIISGETVVSAYVHTYTDRHPHTAPL